MANKPKLKQHQTALKSTANITTPTHVTFLDFNDTAGNIWFYTFRLIKEPKENPNVQKGSMGPQQGFSGTDFADLAEPLESAATAGNL